MTKILILYWSAYGHVEQMAKAVAEGARSVDGRRGHHQARAGAGRPRRTPSGPAASSTRAAPVATVDELAGYDAIIFGTPTRFGNMAAQMRALPRPHRRPVGCGRPGRQGRQRVHQQRHAAWRPGVDDPVVPHHAAAPRHGGRRPALHLQGADGRSTRSPAARPYGASTIAAGDGSRQPSENELGMARFQGEHVARIATKLAA